jgi:predicted metalloprotease
MDWTPGGESSDIEDRRDDSGGGFEGGGGGFGGFGGMGGGGLGIGGFVILLVLSLVFGHNFLGGFFGGGGQGSVQSGPRVSGGDAPRAHPAGEDRDVQLISFVLDDAQKTWTQIFADEGKRYHHAKLVLYRDQTYSGCGTAQATTGPFYCPEDEKIYIDLGFWDELKQLGGSTADFAQAYVITHELGHHVQNLLGIESRMQRLVQQEPGEKNPLSVDLELQADCFAGVWAHSTEQRNIVHEDDVAGALKSAAAVGDDHLQQMAGRAVSPEKWTHGSSASRTKWFKTGLSGGTIESCTTFDGKLAP